MASLALAENLSAVTLTLAVSSPLARMAIRSLLGKAVVDQHLEVDVGDVLLGQFLQRAHVDGVVFHAVDVLETSLGQDTVDRHLTAFETDLAAVAGTGLSALVTTGGSAALAGALTSTDSSFSMC